jgi:fumarylacetoacetase
VGETFDTASFGHGELPYGSFTSPEMRGVPRVGVAVGDRVLDLTGAAQSLLPRHADLFHRGSLDSLLAAGPEVWAEVRAALQSAELSAYRLQPISDVQMLLPFAVADYVDFYASEYHATWAAQALRPGAPPLAPNWRTMPVGYHGRAGTVMVSESPIRRPIGQLPPEGEASPEVGPTRRLDFEAEVGYVVGAPSVAGQPVPVDAFANHVFGLCLLNDWSARDIQGWESRPLGPFLGKSFATSISPWIVPLEAVQAARRPVPSAASALPYLQETSPWGLDLTLEVLIDGQLLARLPYTAMHWSPAQMLAHLTLNGTPLRTGDLYASGTVSGPRDDECGCLLEASRNGQQPVVLPDGRSLTWLADGMEVVIAGSAAGPDGIRLCLGEVRGRVLPAASPAPVKPN